MEQETIPSRTPIYPPVWVYLGHTIAKMELIDRESESCHVKYGRDSYTVGNDNVFLTIDEAIKRADWEILSWKQKCESLKEEKVTYSDSLFPAVTKEECTVLRYIYKQAPGYHNEDYILNAVNYLIRAGKLPKNPTLDFEKLHTYVNQCEIPPVAPHSTKTKKTAKDMFAALANMGME